MRVHAKMDNSANIFDLTVAVNIKLGSVATSQFHFSQLLPGYKHECRDKVG